MKNLNKIIWPIFIILLSLTGIYIYEQGKSKSIQVVERVQEVQEIKKIVVQVDGAVLHPGIYQVTENLHLYELLLMVQPLPDADLQKFNLAEVLKDGALYRIPALKKEIAKPALSSVSKVIGKININKATAEELSKIPGIGISYAERIVEYRNEKGYFGDKNELLKVKGIGPSKLKAMANNITLD
ncbi:MAG: helix-hairpin-helix domain-containing protein [Candidatus Margulisbacteria bacterium]|nr:helix-hairpin-helix domain-containing protein [Candidatus Margulisiibacteriota bacterium]